MRIAIRKANSVVVTWLAALTLSLVCSVALAQDEAVKNLYATCSGCHGSNGEGNLKLHAPRLAGQTATYIAGQLKQFRTGLRGVHQNDIHGARMSAFAKGVPEEQVVALSNYISNMDSPYQQEAVSGDVENGKYLYNSTCLACHGVNAEGNSHLKTPNLNILSNQYIQRQLHGFTEAWRGKPVKPVEGNISAIWMRTISTHINDPQQLDDLSAYLQTLR